MRYCCMNTGNHASMKQRAGGAAGGLGGGFKASVATSRGVRSAPGWAHEAGRGEGVGVGPGIGVRDRDDVQPRRRRSGAPLEESSTAAQLDGGDAEPGSQAR